MTDRFTELALTVTRRAVDIATESGAGKAGSQHLLLALVENPQTSERFRNIGVTTENLAQVISKTFPSKGKVSDKGFDTDAEKVVQKGFFFALNMSAEKKLSTDLITLAILRDGSTNAYRCLEMLAVDIAQLEALLIASIQHHNGGEPELAGVGAAAPGVAPSSPRGKTSSKKTPHLEQFATNLTQLAVDGNLDPVIGRDKEIERLLQVLSRRTKNNPVLVGEPGVGKTAIVEGLAQVLLDENAITDSLKGRTVWTLDLAGLMAGTRFRGDFEQRLKKIIQEIQESKAIIFIDEIHALMSAGGGEGALNAANILKPVLSRGEMQTIGATTYDEFRKHFEKDAAMARRFQKIDVNEPSIEDAIRILKGIRGEYEEHHNIVLTDAAVETAVKLSARYITDRRLPDKAIDLMDEAGAKAKIARLSTPVGVKELEYELLDIIKLKEAAIEVEDFVKAAEYRSTEKNLKQEIASATKAYRDDKEPVEVTDFDIATLLTASTGIPVNILTNDLKRFMQMEQELNKEVIGQPEAVASIARSIRRQQAGLKDPNRPAGSFLFAGPTGVGKTELAKALTRFLFHDEDALISLDMSEYSEKHTVSRLFGAPPGFVGFEEGGQLTEKVRRKPYSVILFDEVEKAHPDIFNSLLQVLEEGRLTDGQGRVVDFKNTIILLTTNLGARQIATGSIGFAAVNEEASYNTMKSKVMTELKQNFKPEFLNRLDDMIVFPQLNSESLKQIVDLFINRLNMRLVDAGLKVELTDAAKLHLISVGYDQALGARPLRRAIQSLIEDSISEMILFDVVGENKTIVIDFVDNMLLFDGMTRRQIASSKEALEA